jgi:outer membrane receptor protein involved in Fe transport
MPETRDLPEELQRPDFSQPFQVINAQLSYRSKRWEVYVGCENVADFRQIRPIIGWQQPFGRFFDTSSVWGPTRGREFYLGMRYDIKRNISG